MTFPPLHVVTDDAVLASPDFARIARTVLAAGGSRLALHVRGHATTGEALYDHAAGMRASATAAGARLVVNDRVDIARAACADGVQLGHRSLSVRDARAVWPGAWVGVSVHSPREAREAASAGTDFVVLGTIYATSSHPGWTPAGVRPITEAAAAAAVPVVAIGGITAARIGEVVRAGASGIAVLGAVWHADDPAAAVGTLLDAWEIQGRGEP